MAMLLTAAATVIAIYLVLSSVGSGTRASGSAPVSRGSWGILSYSLVRNRPLNAQERRWQTLLLTARENPSRWGDVVSELERLEQAAGAVQHLGVPDRYDAAWIDNRLDHLEARASDSSPTGETSR